MLDASNLSMEENLALADELLAECADLDVILELEIGIVGGVEDASDHEGIDRSKMYTSPEDMVRVTEKLGPFDRGLYLLAAVFGTSPTAERERDVNEEMDALFGRRR